MPGVYEGGLKVWEASLDLVEYLVNSEGGMGGEGGLLAQNEATAMTGRRQGVLEVGMATNEDRNDACGLLFSRLSCCYYCCCCVLERDML